MLRKKVRRVKREWTSVWTEKKHLTPARVCALLGTFKAGMVPTSLFQPQEFLMKVQNKQGFTLVEMLVVIAIIAILAVALFPAIQSAINTARATSAKSKGRNAWLAISSANTERDILSLGMLWPGDLLNPQDGACTFNTAEGYWTYLMSDGSDKTGGEIVKDVADRIVTDLTPDKIITPGIQGAPGNKVGAGNNAWHVFKIFDTDAAEMPFLLTRNADASKIATNGDDTPLGVSFLGNIKPFAEALAVWVTRGGNAMDARRKYLNLKLLCPVTKDAAVSVEYLPSDGGYGG